MLESQINTDEEEKKFKLNFFVRDGNALKILLIFLLFSLLSPSPLPSTEIFS